MTERWRLRAGTRETAPAQACSHTDVLNPGVASSVTSERPRVATSVPKVYLVPSATSDPRAVTRGTRAVAGLSATGDPNPAAIIIPPVIEGMRVCTRWQVCTPTARIPAPTTARIRCRWTAADSPMTRSSGVTAEIRVPVSWITGEQEGDREEPLTSRSCTTISNSYRLGRSHSAIISTNNVYLFRVSDHR